MIFYHNEQQKATAEKYKALLNKENAFGKPVVTTLEKAQTFYVAENYHQDYFLRNGEQPYCRIVILPKMDKLEKFYDKVVFSDVFLKLDNTSEKENKVVEIKVQVPGDEFVVKKQCKSFEEGTDLAVDSLERVLIKRKEKVK